MKILPLALLVILSLDGCDRIPMRAPSPASPSARDAADGGEPVVDTAAASCALGRTPSELATDDARIVQTDRLEPASDWPDDLLAQALALGRASGVVATRAPELLAGLGVAALERTMVYDRPSARSFVVLLRPDRGEGLVFAERTERVVARVEHGEFAACAAPRARCHVGATERAFLDEPRFVTLDDRTFSASSLPDPTDVARLIAAVRVARPEVASVASALTSVDAGQVRRITRREPGSGRVFALFVYGAGDNPYGAVFEVGDTPVVEVRDGDFYGCTALDPF